MKLEIGIDKLFKIFNKNTPGCAVRVIQNGNIILDYCIGLADVESKIPITPNTAFRLASLTKPFTAMAIMILAQRKLLRYTDQLNKFFPDFPAYGKNITVKQLLSHTSGIPDHEKPLYEILRKDHEPTIYDSLEILKQQNRLLFKPSNRFAYSDAGYVLLALIIEKVSSQKYAKFLKKNIFDPLLLKNTLVVDETKPKIINQALGYKMVGNKYKLFDYDPLNYIIGDEGIYSTIKDLSAWIRAWANESLVSKKTIEEALAPRRLPSGRINPCGFSWFIKNNRTKKIFYHGGFWVGFNNIMLAIQNTATTVIMLSNTTMFPTRVKRLKIATEILKATKIAPDVCDIIKL